ncbi:tyrosine-type recombinase/integrase [Paracoccus sp. 12-3]|nr:tyrosine-type recombinase/integrase [Paracoccus xiamenensis]
MDAAWLKVACAVRQPLEQLPPLQSAIRAQTVVGPTYLLNGHGQPFASKSAFGNKFRDWAQDAGLTDRTPHGIQKAAAELLALHGASQYHIMAIHGHSNAKTSEVYTRGADRDRLAEQAMEKLAGLDW